jgi:hypothetical protein
MHGRTLSDVAFPNRRKTKPSAHLILHIPTRFAVEVLIEPLFRLFRRGVRGGPRSPGPTPMAQSGARESVGLRARIWAETRRR